MNTPNLLPNVLITHSETRTTDVVAFNIVDKYGRAVGARVLRFVVESIPRPATGYHYATAKPVGIYYAFEPSATRDGATYGASQRFRVFATEGEREAAISKYIASAKRRAPKTAKGLTQKEKRERSTIIAELSTLSRDGWSKATRAEYQRLEARLDMLNKKDGRK